mmetsp:Transcript_21557/g.67622  ORF Transcript_21557/g.67622 Transcript_21557/m.67622 type:complete len:464 (-) Transcript_21557:185-1576(-)
MLDIFFHLRQNSDEEVCFKLGVPLEKWKDRSCGALFVAFTKQANATRRAGGKAPIADASLLRFYTSDGTWLSPETTVSDLAPDDGPAHVTVREHASNDESRVRAAIVCQLKDASARLESFVRYHLLLGFDRIYLYFDDCSEVDDAERARALGRELGGRVVVTVRDRALLRLWSRLDGWEHLRHFANDDVQVRQMLNALDALDRARRDGVHWLLHIDSDELFYPGPDTASVGPHFQALDASPCSIFTYYNFEAVPDRIPGNDDPADDPFRRVTLFKRPLALVPEDSSPAAERAVRFWRCRAPNNQPFLFYQNGKSAVRCSLDAVPTSVHLWAPRQSGPHDPRLHQTNDPRNTGVVYDASVTCGILHFACSDPLTLWRKYATLGAFPNQCVADTVAHEPDTFHCLCRDEYLKHRAADDGGQAALRALFESRVALTDENEIARHLAAGTLQRIELPRTLLLRSYLH